MKTLLTTVLVVLMSITFIACKVDDAPFIPDSLEQPMGLKAEPRHNKAKLMWKSVRHAAKYEVSINDRQYLTASNKIDISTLTPQTEYEWSVRALNGEVASDWAHHSFITTDIPVVPVPTGLNHFANYERANLSWLAVDEAWYYQVCIDGKIIDVTDGTEYNITGLLPATTYCWEVRAVIDDVTGNWASSSFDTEEFSWYGIWDGVSAEGRSRIGILREKDIWQFLSRTDKDDNRVCWIDIKENPDNPNKALIMMSKFKEPLGLMGYEDGCNVDIKNGVLSGGYEPNSRTRFTANPPRLISDYMDPDELTLDMNGVEAALVKSLIRSTHMEYVDMSVESFTIHAEYIPGQPVEVDIDLNVDPKVKSDNFILNSTINTILNKNLIAKGSMTVIKRLPAAE